MAHAPRGSGFDLTPTGSALKRGLSGECEGKRCWDPSRDRGRSLSGSGPRTILRSLPRQTLSPSTSLDATRRRILEFITSHPGAHLRDICRALGLAMGDVQYHIRRLERDGRIHSVRRGLYKFFYPANLFGERQRDVLSVLSLDRPRELLLNIIEHPESTQEALAGATHISQPTVSWHLKRLVDLGIVGRRQEGRVVTYSVVGGRRDSNLHQDLPPHSLGEMVE